MLNEQQREKVQELENAFKKLANISYDDYYYKLLLYPKIFKFSLEFEENKDKLLEELSVSWKNIAITPNDFNTKQNCIDMLRWKTHFLEDKMEYSDLRLTYSDVLIKVYETRKNLNENIEIVEDVLKRVGSTEAKEELSKVLTELFEAFSILNSNI